MKFEVLERRASDRLDAPPNRRWHGLDRPSWRSFFIALLALSGALFLALYSGTAAESGHLVVAITSALAALALAGWVALTIVPVLARRTPLRWLTYQIDYKLTREGMVYLAGIFVVAVSAVNTGNNLLFMILSCLLAGVLISGFLSRLVLSGIDVRLELPEHIFAQRTVLAIAELQNTKQMMPSFSVSLVSEERPKTKKDKETPRRSPRRAFLNSPSTSRTSLTATPCGKTSSLRFRTVGFTGRTLSDCARNFHLDFFRKRAASNRALKRSCTPRSSRPKSFTRSFRSSAANWKATSAAADTISMRFAITNSMTAPGMSIGKRRREPAHCKCANTRARTSAA